MTPILLSWSGGKDSAWALQRLRSDPRWRVCGLLTTLTEGYDRISIHGVRREILQAQAEAAALPLIEAWIAPQCDNAHYEAAFVAALAQARQRWAGLEHIAFGDLFLEDIRSWRESLCGRHGWRAEFPLFGTDTRVLAHAMMAAGMQATLCCVDTTRLDARFAGEAFDADLLAALPERVDPCGENGEFHTCVWAGPMFSRPLPLRRGERLRREARFEYCELQLASSG